MVASTSMSVKMKAILCEFLFCFSLFSLHHGVPLRIGRFSGLFSGVTKGLMCGFSRRTGAV